MAPITLTYSNPDGIEDVDGLPAPTFTDQPVTNNVEGTLTDPDVTVPDQNFLVGNNLPHSVDLQFYNVGGPIDSITTDVGTVSGNSTILFDDVVSSGAVSATATNTAGTIPVAFNYQITETLTAPIITGNPTIDDTTPMEGQTLTVTFAPSDGNPSPTDSALWNGAGVPNNQPTYTVVAEDIGNTLQVTQFSDNTVSPIAQATSAATAPVYAAPAFEAQIYGDNLIQIINNDGRDFEITHDAGRYNGTVRVPPGSIDSQPLALFETRIGGTSATPGVRLNIVPALWAYDASRYGFSESYTTNGVNTVDLTNPDYPTLLIDAADVGKTITVTHTANGVDSTSNGILIEGGGAGTPILIVDESFNIYAPQGSNVSVVSTPMNLSGLQAGDTFCLWYGDRILDPSGSRLSVGGSAPIEPSAYSDTSSGGFSGIGIFFEYVMPADGAVDTDIEVTNTQAVSTHVFSAWGVRDAVRVDLDMNRAVDNVPRPVSTTVNAPATPNLIVAATVGNRQTTQGHIWTGVTDTMTNGVRSAAGAQIDATPGSYGVDFEAANSDTSTDLALIAVAYSGA